MINGSIHPLKRWLFEREMTPTAFAGRYGFSNSTISEIVSRKKTPSLAMVARLCAATGGDLTANDFMPPVSPQEPAS